MSELEKTVDEINCHLRVREDLGRSMIDFDALIALPQIDFPPKFKMPTLPTFGGKGKPKEHMLICNQLLCIHGVNKEHIACLFLLSLKDGAFE